MPKDDYSVFGIPRFDIIKIKKDDFLFSDDFHKGSNGLAIFMTVLFSKFKEWQIPFTLYLYGKGALSNEWSENFNYPSKRPDLLLCQGAIRPRVLIDIKYQEIHKESTEGFEAWLAKFTRGGMDMILCNKNCFEEYLSEADKIGCPVYIIRVYEVKGRNNVEYQFFGLRLSQEAKTKLQIKKKGKKEVYSILYEHLLQNADLFNALKILFHPYGKEYGAS